MPISADTIFLDPGAEGTLQRQIQQVVAEGILSGRFRRGEKMPSTRRLAEHLGVSRITVTLAFTELQADDYLTSRGRSGFYVSENAPEPAAFAPPPRTTDTVDWPRALSQRFSHQAAMEKPLDWSDYRYPFIYGQADARFSTTPIGGFAPCRHWASAIFTHRPATTSSATTKNSSSFSRARPCPGAASWRARQRFWSRWAPRTRFGSRRRSC